MQVNRKYLSYSGFNLWQSSKTTFYRRYVLNESPPFTRELAFGKQVMADFEFAHGKFYDMYPEVRPPESWFVERELYDEVNNLMGIVDCVAQDYHKFLEYKTGRVPWTQQKVNADEQLLWYAMLIYIRTEEIPTAELIWLETELIDEEVYPTGRFEVFERTFTKREINAFLRKVIKTKQEIADYVYVDKDVTSDRDQELYDVTMEIERLTAIQEALKDDIFVEMSIEALDRAHSDNASYTIQVRKNLIFEAEDMSKITQLEAEISDIKTKAINEDRVRYTYSSSLLYRPKRD